MWEVSHSTTIVTVGKKGRIVIPATMRRDTGLTEGTEAIAHVDADGRLILDTPVSIKTRVRRRAAAGRSMPGTAVDQLRQERRTDRSLFD
jgi:AbrB family looped-hinge helix DNA binding protein